CLHHHVDGSAHRITQAPPHYPIHIDLQSCRVALEGAPPSPFATPTYLFPPTLAAALRDRGIAHIRVHLTDIEALDALIHAIPKGEAQDSAGFQVTFTASSSPHG
ncbi:MAG: hypothetical protein AAFS10_23595, partial [Myxococcota bacterium]